MAKKQGGLMAVKSPNRCLYKSHLLWSNNRRKQNGVYTFFTAKPAVHKTTAAVGKLEAKCNSARSIFIKISSFL